MSTLLTLIRRQLHESRWSLGLTSAALLSWALFNAWRTLDYERLIEQGETTRPPSMTRGPNPMFVLRVLGGAAMDYSTTAMEVCWWNHPVVIFTILAWATSRGAGSVAGEIERGTIDVTLSRPISRSAFLTSHIVIAVFGLMLLVGALILGCLLGNVFFAFKNPARLSGLVKAGSIVLTAGMAIFGYTLPFSSIDVARWRPALASVVITIGGLICLSVGSQFPRFEWVENLSVFQLYAPVTVAVKGEPLFYNVTMLSLVFIVGIAVSYWAFGRRDLPSNS